MLSTAKERFQLVWHAVESNYFPQLRSVFCKTVRCGKCILSAANRGFSKGSRTGESGKQTVNRGCTPRLATSNQIFGSISDIVHKGSFRVLNCKWKNDT
jgi:hypothetical protein